MFIVRQSGTQGQYAVDEVSVVGVQHVVDLGNELLPREIRVFFFRHLSAQVVAECVSGVALQERWEPNGVFS